MRLLFVVTAVLLFLTIKSTSNSDDIMPLNMPSTASITDDDRTTLTTVVL